MSQKQFSVNCCQSRLQRDKIWTPNTCAGRYFLAEISYLSAPFACRGWVSNVFALALHQGKKWKAETGLNQSCFCPPKGQPNNTSNEDNHLILRTTRSTWTLLKSPWTTSEEDWFLYIGSTANAISAVCHSKSEHQNLANKNGLY
jgi:hypothetical protein